MDCISMSVLCSRITVKRQQRSDRMNKPTINEEEAMRQAGMTFETYLSQAIEAIDSRFGRGHARGSHVLLAAAIRMQADDFNNTSILAALYEIAESIEGVIE